MDSRNILSEEEKYQILREVVSRQELEVFDEEDFLQDIAEEIGKIKNNRLSLDEFVSAKVNADAFRDIYRAYEERRKSLRKIDFDDMLVVCYELFASRPDVLELWQKKFRYILVDEFQDINRVQYDVIRMLALPENNLYVVGDDDQAIYGFRGADSELMFQFLKDYPDARQITLGKNYRSTGKYRQKFPESNQSQPKTVLQRPDSGEKQGEMSAYPGIKRSGRGSRLCGG